MAFRVGQKVVYVGHDDYEREPSLVIGNVYTVARCYLGLDAAIELIEVDSPEDEEWEAGFLALVFRPVVERKTDISIFKKMLVPNSKSLELV